MRNAKHNTATVLLSEDNNPRVEIINAQYINFLSNLLSNFFFFNKIKLKINAIPKNSPIDSALGYIPLQETLSDHSLIKNGFCWEIIFLCRPKIYFEKIFKIGKFAPTMPKVKIGIEAIDQFFINLRLLNEF